MNLKSLTLVLLLAFTVALPAAKAQPPGKLPLAAGELAPGTVYYTPDGSKFLVFLPDDPVGDKLWVSTKGGKRLWGLGDRPGVNHKEAARARVTEAGRFEVLNAAGKVIWSIQATGPENDDGLCDPIEGQVLTLTPYGVPMMTFEGLGELPEGVSEYNLPLVSGITLQQGVEYRSPGFTFYLIHQADNNLCVYRASDKRFVWGLNEQRGVNYEQAARVRIAPGGVAEVDGVFTPISPRLEVLDGTGKVIYKVEGPGGEFGLDPEGRPVMKPERILE
ncbi:MAG: hypothetical protein R3C49_01255 [Planctomycetaceae bacterium]